jgi:hypothetical protein
VGAADIDWGAFNQTNSENGDPCHPSSYGYSKIAEYVADLLRRRGPGLHGPLTHNEAERALRHWLILRRIGYGTRTMVGSRSFALLASIIDTCRKRKVSPWPYLAEVIARGRRGQEAPALPSPA